MSQQTIEFGFADVVAQITDKLQAGEKVDVEQYVANHPDWAERLRELLPALQVMAELGQSAGGASGQGPTKEKADSADELQGTLGDFRIVREIGRGGMGVVYEAEQISLHRRVALKVLPLASTMDPRRLQRFHNEARAAACLHHTNIVPVHAVGCERGVHFYAMQLIDGQTLAALIADFRLQSKTPVAPLGRGVGGEGQPTPLAPQARRVGGEGEPTPLAPAGTGVGGERQPATASTVPQAILSTVGPVHSGPYCRKVAELGAQAATALDYAHQMGVVHRDVKPGNLMLETSPLAPLGRGVGGEGFRVWITDFGLAQLQTEAGPTLTGELMGTLRYMSPEQALAKRIPIDHRTDVYLGATLYELLTLKPVFAGKDRQELLQQIAFDEPVPPRRLNRSIPTELETIVLKALEKNPQDRYATAQELADDLGRFLKDEPIRAKRPGLLARGQKWSRRHRAGVSAAAVCLLMAMAALAGSIGWVARDRAARQSASENVIRAALAESDSWQQKRRLPEALSDARRADGLLAGADADEALKQQVHDRMADLQLVEKLERIRLEAATAQKDNRWDRSRGLARYGEAFREAGLDVKALPAEEAAERIRRTTVPVELAAALDHWTLLRLWDADPSWKALFHLARLADPDPGRTRLREAMERRDKKTLRALAASPEVFDLPIPTLGLLANFRRTDKEGAGPVEAFLRDAQRRHPDDFWINYELYEFVRHTQPPQLEDAVRFAAVMVALQPGSPGARYNLGNILRDEGRLDDAIHEFQKAIALDPKYASAHNNVGVVLQTKGRLDEAIDEFRKAIALDPKHALAHTNLAGALFKKGRLDDAIDEYRKAIDIEPKFAQPHNNLGGVLALQGRLEEAIAEFRKAVDLDPKFAGAHYNLGTALVHKGRLDEGIAQYNAKERARLRRQALDWLHDDLKAYRQALDKSPDKAGPTVAQKMQHWLVDRDFAGVRGAEALAQLPEAEREEWQKLWQDVEALVQRATAQRGIKDQPPK